MAIQGEFRNMNWGIVVGLGVVALIVMLALMLKGGFLILLGWILLLGLLGFILYMVYKYCFPPGWQNN